LVQAGAVKLAAAFAAVACVALAGAAVAGATDECRGLQVCVPVAGPWVVTPAAGVEFQLECPRRFVVGGLDAELSNRAIDVGFVGFMGSPVNPGVTTRTTALFLGRYVGRSNGASFRPHIGCTPISGSGQRTPTAYHAFKPGTPTIRVVKEFRVSPGTRRFAATCGTGRRLIRATHAVGFYTFAPPPATLIANLRVQHVVHGGRVVVTAQAGAAFSAVPAVPAIVQVDLVCVVGT
jgi:hypothetical protein